MTISGLADTGLFVALFDPSESGHAWATEIVRDLRPPLLTCEPVLTEACFLLVRHPQALRSLLHGFARGSFRIGFSFGDHIAEITALIHRYEKLPMSLADACLVRMSELHPEASVLTLDHHFRIYRKHGRHVIPTIMPPR